MSTTETVTEPPRALSSVPHPTHKFRMLLRREFWEHKGGLLWVPVAAGGAFLLLSLILFRGNWSIHAEGNELGVRALIVTLGAENMRVPAEVMDLGLYMASSWPLIAMGFVVSFYCLGTLYDERKDRSVLFWKSLPLSDRAMVLSKVATAALVAPGLATAIAIVTMFGFLGLVSVVVLANGGSPVRLLWEPGSPLTAAGNLIAYVPAYAVWALPTVGWLLLCSAWAKNKPFLWATMIPVFAGVFATSFHAISDFQLVEPAWFWDNIVFRMLFSAMPDVRNTLVQLVGSPHPSIAHGPEVAMSLTDTYRVFTTPEPWVGALAGVAMIYGAIRVRRWRDEG